jgi:hypothetical protein
LTGNSGTTPWNGTAGNFLGTTDATDLVFGTNNVEGMRLTSAGNLTLQNSMTVSGNVNINTNLLVGGNTTLGSSSAAVSTQVFSQNNTVAALAVVNNGSAPALEVENTGGGLAISIADGGGGVKVSHGTVSVSGSAATVPSNLTAVQITGDNNGANDNITLPNSAVNGTILYVRYVSTGDNAVFIGVNPDGSNYTTTGSAHLTFVYIGGAWRLMGVQE